MSRLFSSRKRFMGLGVVTALVVALAVLGTLWGVSQTASANADGVGLVHLNPDGSDYTGNPYCPDTEWVAGVPTVDPAHDCNNITSQNHVIRTDGWTDADTNPTWSLANASGATATIEAEGRCGDLAEVTGRANWDGALCANDDDDDDDDAINDGCPIVGDYADCDANENGDCADAGEADLCGDDDVDDDGDTVVNDGCPAVGVSEDMGDQQCVVIHSSTPGETRVSLSYDEDGTTIIAGPVMKEWDSLVDSVILKGGDEDLVKVYYDADGDTVVESSEYKSMWLPKDMNGDGVRDADDEHEMDKQSEWQDHPVYWDEAKKRLRSIPPVHIIEVVHGEHDVLINAETITVHQPTEGAVILAEIESERGCTYFTDDQGLTDLGDSLEGYTDSRGRFLVWIDTICEEQATIHFYASFPPMTGSLRQGLHEWVGINWTTVEEAKQPQIRWAGEEIILAKRWALAGQWYPNTMTADTATVDQPICPLATSQVVYEDSDGDELDDTATTHRVNYVLKDPGLGALEGGYVDSDGDGILDSLSFLGQSEAVGDIDDMCISKALADSEEPGQQDIEAKLMEVSYTCLEGEEVLPEVPGPFGCYVPLGDDEYLRAGDPIVSETLVNKHAFLVWYLKIYEVKLTNVDGERASHNDGAWSFGEGEDTVADTLNVSQDALLRVTVKGWFEGGNNSGRGAMCVDIDGDGNELEGELASEPGEAYEVLFYEEGCDDPDDEILDHGHWVLPDDLPALAGPDAILTRPNWDVMSEATASKTSAAIGPKSTLDSHDTVLRSWIPCAYTDPVTDEVVFCARKTVAPDGAITAADAIMPPLKIRASMPTEDAGFLKQALKDDVYAGKNDYHSIMIPADPEIPAMVNNGGYDWDSWLCRIEDGNLASPADPDKDGLPTAVDNCPNDYNPNQYDLDADTIGDVCDDDIDGDGTDNDDDVCDYDDTIAVVGDGAADADGDGVPVECDIDDTDADADDEDADGDEVKDASDNCPTVANADQTDTDNDKEGDLCDADPENAPTVAPIVVCPPSLQGLALGPYEFWTIINKSGAPYPYYIEFYTDNRGEGMFFANGDYNLFADRSLDECGTDPVSGAPDCSPGDVVGESNITVIGDYPYFRKHASVQSNAVVKTWEWDGFKTVTHERIDATHIAIIAHLKDRDGFCKFKVGADPTAANAVTFSPSMNPVQGEDIQFVLNTQVGSIIDVSPNGLYNVAHTPLSTANVTGLADGFVNAALDSAVALAEDERVLAYYDEERGHVADDECQAWIVVEHPLGEEPDVSVLFDDPEGVITRHWPPSTVDMYLVGGPSAQALPPLWNDSCYVGPSQDIEDAVADIVDDVLIIYRHDAATAGWDRWVPDRCDEEGLCTMTALEPYDQLIILMADSATWTQEITVNAANGKDEQVDLVAGWNSVCYAGDTKSPADATAGIVNDVEILYTLGNDQMWRRYAPGRAELDTMITLKQYTSVFVLVTTEAGVTWEFDP